MTKTVTKTHHADPTTYTQSHRSNHHGDHKSQPTSSSSRDAHDSGSHRGSSSSSTPSVETLPQAPVATPVAQDPTFTG